jgi:hypothetical protein
VTGHAPQSAAVGFEFHFRPAGRTDQNFEKFSADCHGCLKMFLQRLVYQRSVCVVLFHFLGKARDLDDHSLVRAFPDDLFTDAGLYTEFHAAIVQRQQFRRKSDGAPHGRRGSMPDIHVCPDRIVAGIEHREDQIAASPLHTENHLGSGKHARAVYSQKFDGVIVSNLDQFLTFRANLVVSHSYGDDSRTAGIGVSLATLLLNVQRRMQKRTGETCCAVDHFCSFERAVKEKNYGRKKYRCIRDLSNARNR